MAWGELGSDAFEREDYAAAAELWRAEAANGSVEAEFGLGLLYDLGLGRPRNSAAALRWYLEAAGDGFADAQFNVGVMLDAGAGVPRDLAAAATWYARAAANGHLRAQYNLGLLYEGGIGVPRNPDLARAWYEAAGPSLTAAADRAALLPLGEAGDVGPSPHPVAGAIMGPPDEPRAELIWTAESGSGTFQVEVAKRPAGTSDDAPGTDDVLLARVTDRSAVVIDLPAIRTDLLWRVGRLDVAGGASAWSLWSELPRGRAAVDPPVAAPRRLTIQVNVGDDLAQSFAEELSQAFVDGGIVVAVQDAAQPASATVVEYRHPGDAALAASVVALLPVLQPGSEVRLPDSDAAPGEVTLRLVGGPRPSAPSSD